MSGISSLRLQDVRCFAKPQEIKFGKVTLLVGENNSGKSTFLGCYAAFARLASLCDLRDPRSDQPGLFDRQPYCMGDFSTIARDDAKAFVLAGALDARRHTRLQFTFGARRRHPSERSIEIHFHDRGGKSRRLAIRREPGSPEMWRFHADDVLLAIPQTELSYTEISTWLSEGIRYGRLPFGGDPNLYRKRFGIDAGQQALFTRLTNFLRTMPFDAAPISVEPLPPAPLPRRRQYDTNPLGGALTEPIRSVLASAGDALGRFSDIDVRQDPVTRGFEMRFMLSGRWRNLVDLGYGVHAMLPVLRAMSDKSQETVFLLQQPEIHVHPSAQAMLAQVMAKSRHRFIIETHSDHLIDRFRICVMQGVLPPEALRIAYFQRDQEHDRTTVHNISVDGAGNLDGEPPEYRTFFLQETNRLLGIE